MQLVNVDLFGEGFDLPAIEVVSFARPTQSYAVYAQQFGRALRIMEGKDVAIIIDHTGNVIRHGLPDTEKVWSLDSRERRPRSANDDDDIPLRYCTECTQPYGRELNQCPHCGAIWTPAERGGPRHVDGDLCELDPAILAQMRGEIERIDEDPIALAERMQYAGAPRQVVAGARAQHERRQAAQRDLRGAIAWWAAWHKQLGRDDREIHRRFWFKFDTDIMTAQTLGRNDAFELTQRVNADIEVMRNAT